jgi:hypothetical protein
MRDWLLGLLILSAIVVVGVLALAWVIGLLKKLAKLAGDVVSTTVQAMATGGVSLFTAGATLDVGPHLPKGKRRPLRVVLDAFATGGVSLFAEPPQSEDRELRRK